MNILVKSSAIKYWKPKMEILDFYIAQDESRYTLNKIIEQNISQINNSAKVKIEYYDSKNNFVKNQEVIFNFNKNKKTTLQEMYKEHDFLFNEKKLNSLNFINFDKNDVKILKPNLTIEKITIKNWLIFGQTINFKIDCLFYNEIKYSLLIQKKFKINYVFLIKNLLVHDAKNSFLKINSYMEFEVEKFSSEIKGYKDFFGQAEYKKLFKIIDGIEIINPKILTNQIDIFSSEAVDYFNASIIINKIYIKNFVFKSRYDAQYLKKFIANKLTEYPCRQLVLGSPRNNNIMINDIYKDFKKVHFKFVLKDIGMPNLIEDNTYVKMDHFNFLENSGTIEIYLKNNGNKPLIRKKMKFENTIVDFLNKDFSKNNLVLIKDTSILQEYPNPNLKAKDFVIQGSKDIKIINVNISKKTPIQSKWISYNFKLIKKTNENEELTFNYIQDFYFQNSKIEYFLKIIKLRDVNIDYFKNQSDEYFYNIHLKNKLNQKNISITNAFELKNIIINNKYEETDFKITCLKFNKDFIFKKEIPISLFIKSKILKSTKILYTNLRLKNRKLYNEFKILSGNDIKITNNKLIDSFPIPILDISDFYVKKPFFILDITSKYNDDNMSVLCSFIIKFKDQTKLIKKEIYFKNEIKKSLSPSQYKLNLKLFNDLTKKDIVVNYDKNQFDYFIKPKVSFVLPSSEFYAKINDWKLKWRFTKAVVLNIEIQYCNMSKNIKKKIIYDHKISKANFKSWKEANYAGN